jgi:hypothetical protein
LHARTKKAILAIGHVPAKIAVGTTHKIPAKIAVVAFFTENEFITNFAFFNVQTVGARS